MKKLLLIFSLIIASSSFSQLMYFVTTSDKEHFPWLEGLIDSIKKYNHGKIAKIAVFNIGLTKKQIDLLNNQELVQVYEIEPVNAGMNNKFVVRVNGRLARGWYSWKPAVLYQALKIFPYILYLDSGFEVVAPLDEIFNEIIQKGYFLYDCGHLIMPMVTKKVSSLFELDLPKNKWILEENGISGGLQGLSRKMFDSYVEPIYKLTNDISNFEDDGSAPWGFGGARHDQALFSIFARKLNLQTHTLFPNPKKIRVGDKKIYFGALKYFKFRKHHEKDPKRLIHANKYKLLG